jgi:hypothetical protein
MKTEPDDHGTAENASGSANDENETRRPRYRRKQVRARKILKRDQTHSAPSKMSQGRQNMETELDDLYTAENESESVKHEN